jgi:hypothetical protein
VQQPKERIATKMRNNNTRQTIATQGEEEQHKTNNNNERGTITTQGGQQQYKTTQGK